MRMRHMQVQVAYKFTIFESILCVRTILTNRVYQLYDIAGAQAGGRK